jgi:hypothetical protein
MALPGGYSDTPLATQQINQTQAPIRTNFMDINVLVAVNHVSFNDPVNFGKHNVSDYIGQVNTPLGSVPGFITALPAGEFNIYNTVPNGNSVLNTMQNPGYPVTLATNEIIIERGAAPSNSFIPITATQNGTDAGGATWGWSYLPSGILHKWGYVFNTTNRPRDVSWTYVLPTGTNIPVFKSIQTVLITSTDNINDVRTPGLNITVLESWDTATFLNITVYPMGTFSSGSNANDWAYLIIGT